jgi:hypothetical protein
VSPMPFAFVIRLQALIELRLVASEKQSILLIPSISDTGISRCACMSRERATRIPVGGSHMFVCSARPSK